MTETYFQKDSPDAAPDTADDGGLWFVTCVSNPVGYASRGVLYERFVRHRLQDLGARLAVCECAYGEQEHAFADVGREHATPENFLYVPVRARSVMWHKERLINVAIQALPPPASTVCWCDADVHLLGGREAVGAICAALRVHPVVQAFSVCLELGPDGRTTKVDFGYAFSAAHGPLATYAPLRDQTLWHSGYAWAARRSFLEEVGGLYVDGILGSGDRFMGDEFFRHWLKRWGGRGDEIRLVAWGEKARTAIGTEGGGVGYVPTVLSHGFHGHKSDRGSILVRNAFDPSTDLVVNDDGLFEWAGNKPALEREVLDYFRSRNEDP